jgi:hypothetical protein
LSTTGSTLSVDTILDYHIHLKPGTSGQPIVVGDVNNFFSYVMLVLVFIFLRRLLIVLALPWLVISFLSECMESAGDSWFYLIAFVPSMMTFMVLVLPSHIQERIQWIDQLYLKMIDSHSYCVLHVIAKLNSFNSYVMFRQVQSIENWEDLMSYDKCKIFISFEYLGVGLSVGVGVGVEVGVGVG